MAGGRACRAGGGCRAARGLFRGRDLGGEGHFLVYGLPGLEEAPPGILVRELIAVVRRHKAAIVAAHPFRWDQPFDQIVLENGAAFDALELVSNNIDRATRAKTQALLREYPMGATGSSDAHDVDVVGCYFTEFPGRIDSISDFVAALQRGRAGLGIGRAFSYRAAPSNSCASSQLHRLSCRSTAAIGNSLLASPSTHHFRGAMVSCLIASTPDVTVFVYG